jgi:hypothetical protein
VRKVNSPHNFGVIFAIHLYFFSDRSELFEAVTPEHHCNRDIGRILRPADYNTANSTPVLPSIKTAPPSFPDKLQTHH